MISKGYRDYNARVNTFERLRFLAEQEKYLIDSGQLVKITKERKPIQHRTPKEEHLKEILTWFANNGQPITEEDARRFL
jgi:hypothetical protein